MMELCLFKSCSAILLHSSPPPYSPFSRSQTHPQTPPYMGRLRPWGCLWSWKRTVWGRLWPSVRFPVRFQGLKKKLAWKSVGLKQKKLSGKVLDSYQQKKNLEICWIRTEKKLVWKSVGFKQKNFLERCWIRTETSRWPESSLKTLSTFSDGCLALSITTKTAKVSNKYFNF